MNLNKSDIFAVIAIIVSLGIPFLGGSFAVLNGLNKSINDLDKTVAVMNTISEQKAVIIEKALIEVDQLQDSEKELRIQLARFGNQIEHLERSILNEQNYYKQNSVG